MGKRLSQFLQNDIFKNVVPLSKILTRKWSGRFLQDGFFKKVVPLSDILTRKTSGQFLQTDIFKKQSQNYCKNYHNFGGAKPILCPPPENVEGAIAPAAPPVALAMRTHIRSLLAQVLWGLSI